MARNQAQAFCKLVDAVNALPSQGEQIEFKSCLPHTVEMAECGEWGLALEILCENLFEYGYRLNKEIIDEIASLAQWFGVDAEHVESLNELVRNDAGTIERKIQ